MTASLRSAMLDWLRDFMHIDIRAESVEHVVTMAREDFMQRTGKYVTFDAFNAALTEMNLMPAPPVYGRWVRFVPGRAT